MTIVEMNAKRANVRREKALARYRGMIRGTRGDASMLDLDDLEDVMHEVNVNRVSTGVDKDGHPTYAEPELDAGGVDGDLAAVAAYPAAKQAYNDTAKLANLRLAISEAEAARDAALAPLNAQIAAAQAVHNTWHRVNGLRRGERQFVAPAFDPIGDRRTIPANPETGEHQRDENNVEMAERHRQVVATARAAFDAQRQVELDEMAQLESQAGGREALNAATSEAMQTIDDLEAAKVTTALPYDRRVQRAHDALSAAEKARNEAGWRLHDLRRNHDRVLGIGSADPTDATAAPASARVSKLIG